MLTELQKEKIAHYFSVVLDQDRNGVLEEQDFLEIGESLCILWRYKPGTADYEEVMEQSRNSWRMFEREFSRMGGVADLANFLKFYEVMLSQVDDEMYDQFVTNVVSNVFDSFDQNGDGVISINEYVDMFMCYHIKIKYSAKAFRKLDLNGDEEISKEELMAAVSEFFKSNDPNAPGNWLFGFWGDKD